MYANLACLPTLYLTTTTAKHFHQHFTQVAETKNGLKAHQKIQAHYTNEFNELETLPTNSWHLVKTAHTNPIYSF